MIWSWTSDLFVLPLPFSLMMGRFALSGLLILTFTKVNEHTISWHPILISHETRHRLEGAVAVVSVESEHNHLALVLAQVHLPDVVNYHQVSHRYCLRHRQSSCNFNLNYGETIFIFDSFRYCILYLEILLILSGNWSLGCFDLTVSWLLCSRYPREFMSV